MIGFSQESNKLDANGLKHGLWKGNHEESKRPRYEGNFEHGKEIGVFKFFDDTADGVVVATREFNSKDNSCYTTFFNQKKNKVSEGKSIGKVLEGKWLYYHEDSPKIMTQENYKNGKLEGLKTVFYLNGKIAEKTNFLNGLKEGVYQKIAENGVLFEDAIYKNNELDGLATYKTADKKIASKGMFKAGKKVGVWQILENGKYIKRNMTYFQQKFEKRIAKPE